MKILKILCVLCMAGFGMSSYALDLAQVKSFTQKGDGKAQDAICQLLDELAIQPNVIRDGTDADQRPIFVGAQADFERLFVHLLKTGEIKKITCIIHTPAPATPLCTLGEISEGLVDPSLMDDPKRLLTVKKRPDIIRDYLAAGGRLFTVYPTGGRDVRSLAQLQILDALLRDYSKNLSAVELNCKEIPQDLIGATYLITLPDSKIYVLSLRSYQANQPKDDKWGIWFGEMTDPIISNRLESVLSFLKSNGFSF